jgi:uncharacterized repeat protein (TIGR02543 family)
LIKTRNFNKTISIILLLALVAGCFVTAFTPTANAAITSVEDLVNNWIPLGLEPAKIPPDAVSKSGNEMPIVMWWDPHLGQQLGDVYMLIASHNEFVDETRLSDLKLGDTAGVKLGTFTGKNVVSDFVPDVKPAFEYFTMIKFANIWPHGDEKLSVPMQGGGHVIGGNLHDYFPQWITISYTVEYYKDNDVLGVPDVFSAFVLETAPKMLTVQTVDTYKNLPFGYKFDHTDPPTIPENIADGDVIKVYYIIDESQIYTITYEATTGGSVSPTSETKQVLTNPTGSTATVTFGYKFTGWTNAAGDTVSNNLNFVPTERKTATFTANFEIDDDLTYTITYEATTGGSVSPTSESHQVLYTGDNDGSTAMATLGYKFLNWVDADGNVVSTVATFVPEANKDATFTANFTIAGENEDGDNNIWDPNGGNGNGYGGGDNGQGTGGNGDGSGSGTGTTPGNGNDNSSSSSKSTSKGNGNSQ